MIVALLTEEQKDKLVGQQYAESLYFGPALDADGNWVLDTGTIVNCIYPEFFWTRELPLIEYKPIIYPPTPWGVF